MTNTDHEIALLRSELKRQTDILRESERFLKESQIIAGLGTYVLDIPQGTWTSSEVLDYIFGIDKQFKRSVEGWASLIHPAWRDTMQDYLTNDVVAKRSRFDKEYKIVRHSDKEERWVHGLGQLDYDDEGRPMRMIGTIMDITERKHVEEALAESEMRFRSFFENAVTGKSVTSPDGKIQVNKAFCDMLGYSQEELSSLKWQQITHPDDVKRDEKIINSIVVGESDSARWEKRYVSKEGKIVWADISTVLQRDTSGKPAYFISTALDVTEHKEVEERIQNSEAFLNRMIEQSPLAMWIADDQGTLIRLNQACCNLLQISADEVVGRYNIFKDNLVQEQGFMPLVQGVFERGETAHFEVNYDSSKVEGLDLRRTAVVILEVTIFPIKNLHGRITNAVIQHNNITDRRRAEETTHQSERRFRAVWEGSLDGMRLTDEDGVVLAVNDAYCRAVGKTREEIEGKPLSAVYSKERWAHIEESHRERFRSRTVKPHFEQELTLWNGRKLWFEVSNSFVELEKQKPLLLGIFRDTTERKQSEEAVRVSGVRYRRLFEAARDGILIVDAETGMVVDVNPFLIELLGYSRETFLGKKIWELGFFKDTAANKVHLTELRRKEFIQYEDMPLETASGRLINVEFVSHVYEVDRHKVIQCNIRDITERKLVEEKTLRQLEELQRWQEVTLGREDRVRQLKREVDELLARLGEPIRYPSEAGASNKQEIKTAGLDNAQY